MKKSCQLTKDRADAVPPPSSFVGMESENGLSWVPELDFTVDDWVPSAGLSLPFLPRMLLLSFRQSSKRHFNASVGGHPALSVELEASVDGRTPKDFKHGLHPCLTQRGQLGICLS